MTSEIEPQIIHLGQRQVLCDASIAKELSEDLFVPDHLRDTGLLTGQAVGRGEAWFIAYRSRNWVLRHFRRGGLVGRFVADRYLGRDPQQCRSWKEWRLLAELYRRGLPVPRPIAASVQVDGLFYRADLITELIAEADSLAGRLSGNPQPAEFWRTIGQCIRRFHDYGVYHADLNANNILVNAADDVFLIDFDRGELRSAGIWKEQNLQRLKRSLLKIQGRRSPFHFSDRDWNHLLNGYRATSR